MPLIVRGQMYGSGPDGDGHPASQRGRRRLAESARAVFAARSSSNVPQDEWGAGLIKRLGGLEMSMEGLDAGDNAYRSSA